MDPITQRILAVKDVVKSKEEQRQLAAEEQAARMRETPEYKHYLRWWAREKAMYTELSERIDEICMELNLALAGVPNSGTAPAPKLRAAEPDPIDSKWQEEPYWTVELGDAMLSLHFDACFYDDKVEFYGEVTVLGFVTTRKVIFGSPDGQLFEVNAETLPCEFNTLSGMLKNGLVPTPTTFEKVLDEALNNLVMIGLEHRIPAGAEHDPKFCCDTSVNLKKWAVEGTKTPPAAYEALGTNVKELRRLAGLDKDKNGKRPIQEDLDV